MEIIDKSSLFKIAYGLYVITMNDGSRDNGMICNAVMQVTNEPLQVAVAINKANYSHEVIQKSGLMNVNVLSEAAPFSVFQNFGFRSGRDNDKFADVPFTRSANGLPVLSHDCNAFYSLKVENYIDLGTHGMFICSVTEAQTLSDLNTMTYTYYQENVKPKKPTTKKKGWICKICGYVYEGDELPPDYICPLCKHPASDFERLDDVSAAPAAPQAAAVEETESDDPKMQKQDAEIRLRHLHRRLRSRRRRSRTRHSRRNAFRRHPRHMGLPNLRRQQGEFQASQKGEKSERSDHAEIRLQNLHRRLRSRRRRSRTRHSRRNAFRRHSRHMGLPHLRRDERKLQTVGRVTASRS